MGVPSASPRITPRAVGHASRSISCQRPRRSSSTRAGRARRRRARGARRFVSSSFVCESPRRLWTNIITVGTPGARDLGRVVQRAARQAVRRSRDLADRLVGRARSASRRRGSARSTRSAPTRPRSFSSAANRSRALLRAREHRGELAGVEVALVEQLLRRLDDRGDDARACRRRRPTCTRRRRRSRARSSRISSASFAAPASASRRLSIGVEPACAAWPRPGDPVALDAEGAEHDAEREVQRLEHRPLLDVQLEVGGRARRAARARRARGRGRRRARRARRAARCRRGRSSLRSSSWSAIEPAAAHEPKSERPKRAPSSSAQLTSRTVTGGLPSSAIRRSTSTPASDVEAAVEPAAVRDRVDVAADAGRRARSRRAA